MQKNVAGQKWIVFAFNLTDNSPVIGDALNITANLRIDGGVANAVDDVNPTELEDGFYVFDLSQAETNGDMILISPASTTADVQVIGVPGVIYTTAPNLNKLAIEADGDLTKVNLCDTVITNIDMRGTDGANTDKTGYELSAAGVLAIWHQALTAVVMAGSVGKLLKDEITSERMATLTDWINGGRLDLILDELTTQGDGSDRLLMIDTVIATLISQTSFTLTAGSTNDDAYNNCTIVIENAATATQKAVGLISDYIGATKTVTLKYDPAIFVMAPTDRVYVLAENAVLARVCTEERMVELDAANLPTDIANIQANTDEIGVAGVGLTNLGGMSAAMKAEVNAEFADVLTIDTVAELESIPNTNPSLQKMIRFLYQYFKNLRTVTRDTETMYKDSGVVLGSASVSETSTMFTKGKMMS